MIIEKSLTFSLKFPFACAVLCPNILNRSVTGTVNIGFSRHESCKTAGLVVRTMMDGYKVHEEIGRISLLSSCVRRSTATDVGGRSIAPRKIIYLTTVAQIFTLFKQIFIRFNKIFIQIY